MEKIPRILLVLPDQLFHINVHSYRKIYIVMDPHYFRKYNYHKLKLAYHYATTAAWAAKHNANIINDNLESTIVDLLNLHKDVLIELYETMNMREAHPRVVVVKNPGFYMSNNQCIHFFNFLFRYTMRY